MKTDDLLRLEALAREATPSPWTTDERYAGRVYCDDATGTQVADCGPFMYVARHKDECVRNAAFVAAAHPEAVLALIDRVRFLEQTLEDERGIVASLSRNLDSDERLMLAQHMESIHIQRQR